MKLWTRTVFLILLATAVPGACQREPIYAVNGRIPLGLESFRMQPGGHEFYLLASVENAEFDGLYRITNSNRHELFRSNQSVVRFYPDHLQFRVTGSTREKIAQDLPLDMTSKLGINDLLSGLHFRLKVFHGLDYRYVKPSVAEMIGMPSEVNYDERVYQVVFDVKKIPIEDRVVMEVLSPNGERLCKFHLDLF